MKAAQGFKRALEVTSQTEKACGPREASFHDLGTICGYDAEIVGISVDSHYSHHAWVEKLHITSIIFSHDALSS